MATTHSIKPGDSLRTHCGRPVASVHGAAEGEAATCKTCRGAGSMPGKAISPAVPGIAVRTGATVLFGSQHACTRPATAAIERVREHTAEWRTKVSNNVSDTSAQWQILRNQMFQRLRGAAGRAAVRRGVDCVVGANDITDNRGLPVTDVTDLMIAELSQQQT